MRRNDQSAIKAIASRSMETVSAINFLTSAKSIPMVDVRSPGEFEKGHIPGAISLPLFKDEERAIVGTIYKQQGREPAIEKGLEFVEPKMQELADRAKELAVDGQLLVHCWRGGMRSNRTAWLFEQNGLKCSVLEGGYKAFRNHILSELSAAENLLVLAGPTGSGKTDILKELAAAGEQVIDLEGLANHRGSAFGALGMPDQPTSQQFQNDLFAEYQKLDPSRRIWVESESLTIGRVYLPEPFWKKMNESPSVQIDMSREVRAKRLAIDYGSLEVDGLKESILKIQQNFGGNRVKQSLELLDEGKIEEVALLLLEYYDKRYSFGRAKNTSGRSSVVECSTASPKTNAELILNHLKLEHV